MRVTVNDAIAILNKGGIVMFPTDTAYGMGCRLDNSQAIEKLFQIRNRPIDKAVPVLVNGFEMATTYWKEPVSDNVRQLTEKHWPGGLTIVYWANVSMTPPPARGFAGTIGLRMPNHEIPLSLIKNIGVPLVGTSANFAGHATPFSFDALDPLLVARVDGVIEGICGGEKSSTVVDCTVNPPKVLREGAVNINSKFEIRNSK